MTALVFAWLLRFERPDLMRGCGVAVAAGGLAIMLTGQLQADWRTGNLITFVNALSFGCFLVVSRPLYRRVHPYAGTAVIFAFGTLAILAAVGWRIPTVDWLALPWWAWAAMAYGILGATVGTYALNAFALRHADASVVGFFIFLQPLIAIAVSALGGGEQLDWRFALAAMLVALGVAIVLCRPAVVTPAAVGASLRNSPRGCPRPSRAHLGKQEDVVGVEVELFVLLILLTLGSSIFAVFEIETPRWRKGVEVAHRHRRNGRAVLRGGAFGSSVSGRCSRGWFGGPFFLVSQARNPSDLCDASSQVL